MFMGQADASSFVPSGDVNIAYDPQASPASLDLHQPAGLREGVRHALHALPAEAEYLGAEGKLRFFNEAGEKPTSQLCPKFPRNIN
jgi:hypothetical protein